ncbi:MAG: hypothetical protein NT062_19650 [Proteobacteria bacterium]|nr:hypothetical protein [Pseudomonadota bacterium]
MIVRKLLSLAVLLLSFSVVVPAYAQNPNVVFKGQILVSEKRFPLSAKSPDAYVAAMRKQSKSSFNEDKEKQGWKLFFVGFLNTKLNDLEYIVKIYDVTAGSSKRLLQSFEQYTTASGEQTITTSFTLDKKSMGVNRNLLITMESNNKVLASGTFKILGEGEKFTGKVDFSNDEDEDATPKNDKKDEKKVEKKTK